MSTRTRKRFFVDPTVQGAFLVRAVVYWMACLATVCLMSWCWSSLLAVLQAFGNDAPGAFARHAPPVLAALLVLPVIAYDTIRLSNRLVGPMVRLRRAMRSLANGEPVKPVHFRKGDFWQDLAEEFNAVAARVASLEQTPPPPAAEANLEPAEVGV